MIKDSGVSQKRRKKVMERGITSDRKRSWIGFFGEVYILKRRKIFEEEMKKLEPMYWRNISVESKNKSVPSIEGEL